MWVNIELRSLDLLFCLMYIDDREVIMSSAVFEEMMENVSTLSYTQRIRLLSVLVQTFSHEQKRKAEPSEQNAAFGIWKDRDISLADIRKKAWR